MATHSSILAWRIPGTEEPDGLPSMGSHRVGRDWSNLSAAARIENGFPCSSVGKKSACSAEDPGSIPRSGRFPGEGNGNPLQYSCLENPMNRGACQATVHGVARVRHYLETKPPPPGIEKHKEMERSLKLIPSFLFILPILILFSSMCWI